MTHHTILAVRLVGAAPLLMRSGRLADPIDPQTLELDRFTRKRCKTAADHAEIARIEWRAGMWAVGERPCVPREAIEACAVQAARRRRAGASARAGLVVQSHAILRYEGPESIDDLWADPRFRLRVPVQVNGRRTMRTRALFPVWSIETEISYLPSLVSERDLLDDLVIAGDQIGLGDWRPRFGRFQCSRI